MAANVHSISEQPFETVAECLQPSLWDLMASSMLLCGVNISGDQFLWFWIIGESEFCRMEEARRKAAQQQEALSTENRRIMVSLLVIVVTLEVLKIWALCSRAKL